MIGKDCMKSAAAVCRLLGWCLATGFFLLTGIAQSQTPEVELFMPTIEQAAQQESLNNHLALREGYVTVRTDAFSEERGVAAVLLINLLDDVGGRGILDRLERNTSGGWVWIGHLDGKEGSEITLVVDDTRVSGTVSFSGRLFHVRHLENELHTVREIDTRAFPVNLSPSLADGVAVQLLAADPLTVEAAVFDLVNQERAIHNLNLLSWDDRLFSAARYHSEDMVANGYFSHTSLDGRTPGQRILDAGYYWNTYGENIAYGYPTPVSVVNAWMNSPGHRANILNPSFCDLGVGFSGYFWTQDFGREQGVYVCPDPQPDECWGDFTEDGNVDNDDLAVFVLELGRTDCSQSLPCDGDFDSDNDVDATDMNRFAADFENPACR